VSLNIKAGERVGLCGRSGSGKSSMIQAILRMTDITVGLWDLIVSKSEATNRLDEPMDEGFLSHGQRQLFCLGRALLKKSHFLILDEPTSKYVRNCGQTFMEISNFC